MNELPELVRSLEAVRSGSQDKKPVEVTFGEFLIWIVAGWFDLFGMSMANGAHIAGLAVGLAMEMCIRDRYKTLH